MTKDDIIKLKTTIEFDIQRLTEVLALINPREQTRAYELVKLTIKSLNDRATKLSSFIDKSKR